MIDRSRPLLARQRALLQRSQLLDGWTSESLAAAGRELGEDVSPACVRGWLAGRRAAPLWALQVILAQAADPLAILGLLAEPHGGRVVHDVEAEAGDPLTEALDVVPAMGAAVAQLQADLADGRLDDPATLQAAERLVQEASELLASVRGRLRVAR